MSRSARTADEGPLGGDVSRKGEQSDGDVVLCIVSTSVLWHSPKLLLHTFIVPECGEYAWIVFVDVVFRIVWLFNC